MIPDNDFLQANWTFKKDGVEVAGVISRSWSNEDQIIRLLVPSADLGVGVYTISYNHVSSELVAKTGYVYRAWVDFPSTLI